VAQPTLQELNRERDTAAWQVVKRTCTSGKDRDRWPPVLDRPVWLLQSVNCIPRARLSACLFGFRSVLPAMHMQVAGLPGATTCNSAAGSYCHGLDASSLIFASRRASKLSGMTQAQLAALGPTYTCQSLTSKSCTAQGPPVNIRCRICAAGGHLLSQQATTNAAVGPRYCTSCRSQFSWHTTEPCVWGYSTGRSGS
jgi:hypothetical protein